MSGNMAKWFVFHIAITAVLCFVLQVSYNFCCSRLTGINALKACIVVDIVILEYLHSKISCISIIDIRPCINHIGKKWKM